MHRKASCALAVCAVLCACTPRVAFYTPRPATSCPKRPPGCSFELITNRPARQYQAIGVIDLEAFSVKKLPHDEASFRAAITEMVCHQGGDAVVPGINGDGRYVLATVVKWVDPGATAPVCPKSEPSDAGQKKQRGAPDAGGAAADAGAAGSPDAAPSAVSDKAGAP